MEGTSGSETHRRTPPPIPAHTDCNHRFSRSDSDSDASSSLTAENCKYIFRSLENVSQDECTAWTNEKHNSYLHHLEMSFVEQLYQSKPVFAQCSGHNLRDIKISLKRLSSNDASEQYNVLRNGCWQEINFATGEPIPSSTPADSHASLQSKRTYRYKHRGMHCHPSPAKVTHVRSKRKHGNEMASHGSQTCPQAFSFSNRHNGDLNDYTREGTGQNFMDEENQRMLNFESRAKRLKLALGDVSHQDHILPSRE